MVKACLLPKDEYVVLRAVYDYVIEPQNELWMSEIVRRAFMYKYGINEEDLNNRLVKIMVNTDSRRLFDALARVAFRLEKLGIVKTMEEGRLVYIVPKKKISWLELLDMYVQGVWREVSGSNAEGKD